MLFFIKDLLLCSKTGHLSSMRLISLLGSAVMLVCIAFLVFSKDVRLGEALPFLMGGLLGLAGFKSYQSKFEGKDNQ
ncbi:hypothetical protein N4239_04835 [Brachyspira hyodysenteriae]|uniref:Uncharacterized protein n=2 Tax=Brachyspira murdochii TaxID=84378 RepID=A0ABX5B353_9SPIR|nr:hypothetical protein [Brachyspira hyodysenteriae]PPS21072.1 hypothetical protein DJ52_13130 [Brachyspira murdochii]WPC23090.1 hypothetical protein N4239_09065 [Brachyspira hyodysenteriae]WPC23143.1 hypothetical protein N4239_09350 [Brachyspira hyodysenteriae]WPC23591.1 hypothetical protein N4239_11670 [Brachyspira hyodysenteriae]WPC23843.1 hypothetical protein N4239_12975 [Brachyspira hyodysenteriae]